jgi:hypothetical protein
MIMKFGRREMLSAQKPFRPSVTIILVMLAAMPGSTLAAVQLGLHMDFVLNDGTSVRVFPAAEDKSQFGLRPVWRGTSQAGPVTPASGNTCAAVRQAVSDRAIRRLRPPEEKSVSPQDYPSWLRASRGLRSVAAFGNVRQMAQPSGWYYLPTAPRLSFRDGKPEATFVKFMTDEETAAGGAEGGLFHMLATFGLTQAQVAELRTKLEESVPGARLLGAVDLEPAARGENFIVTSATLADTSSSSSGIISSGHAPTYPGGKAALAGRMTSIGAQLLENSLSNPIADLSVTFAYQYIAKTPAYHARVEIDLTRVREVSECLVDQREVQRQRRSIRLFGITVARTSRVVGVEDTELREAYETLLNTGAIRIVIDQNLPDADVSVIEGQLMETAMSAFLEVQKSFTAPESTEAGGEQEGEDESGRRRPSGNYRLYTVSAKRESMQGRLSFNVDKQVAVYRDHVMTGNMGAELRNFRQEVFSEAILNDPFFKRGNIFVDIDLDSLDLFQARQINNAAVRVIVPFSGQRDYENNDIFGWQDIQNGKVTTNFTFATRGIEHRSGCLYRYVETWSLRGGGRWPQNPEPVCKTDMAITLKPPIVGRGIEVEADLDEFDRAGIRGADVLLRYRQYGKEKIEAVKFRIARAEPYQELTLYVDKADGEDARTPVEYSTVFVHRDAGNLPQSPWQLLEGDFVFVSLNSLPEAYLERLGNIVEDIKKVVD